MLNPHKFLSRSNLTGSAGADVPSGRLGASQCGAAVHGLASVRGCVYESVLDGKVEQFDPVRCPRLIEDVLDMMLHSRFTEQQPPGNFFVAATCSYGADNLPFAFGYMNSYLFFGWR